jgi:hypothetical protein
VHGFLEKDYYLEKETIFKKEKISLRVALKHFINAIVI